MTFELVSNQRWEISGVCVKPGPCPCDNPCAWGMAFDEHGAWSRAEEADTHAAARVGVPSSGWRAVSCRDIGLAVVLMESVAAGDFLAVLARPAMAGYYETACTGR